MESRKEKKVGDHARMVVVPDDFADQDRIGYQVYIEALAEMIHTVKSKGSFTIGVYGQWGHGKTSMLRQIKKMLDDEPQKKARRVLTIWFNPWQFSSDEHLIIPFFHTLIAGLKRTKEELEEKNIANDFYKKIDVFFKKLVRVPVALAYGLEGEIKIPLFLKTKFSFQKIIDESRRAETEIDEKEAKKEGLIDNESIEQYESLYYNLLQDLQTAAEAFDTKIVVFIDDLDRCLPEKAVQLLEGLKILLDLSNFVFVIGVAREVIERGIRVRYKELYLADRDDIPFMEQDYLDKIIQFPIALPPADPELLKNHILEDQMKELIAAKPFINTIMGVLGNNPRTIKRFINVISFSLWVADSKQEPGVTPFLPELLIKMSLIAFLFPALYRQLGESPHHLIRLQKILWEFDRDTQKRAEGEEGGSPEIGKTKIPKIDQWLEEDRLTSLNEILRCEEREQPEGEMLRDRGFKDEEEVKRYIFMLAPALTPETESREASYEVKSPPLRQEMEGRMRRIKGGKFPMGDDEGDKLKITVEAFEMDIYPVTQSIYQLVMGKNPSSFKGDDQPVESVSWFHAIEFCNRLSGQAGLGPVYKIDGKNVEWIEDTTGFRLPTEAEWEYACRAGTTGDRYGDLDKIAWYRNNSADTTHSVGQLEPNAWGLYDMLGNVWEWCWDLYKEGGANRVHRGGSWGDGAHGCRSAIRNAYSPDYRLGPFPLALDSLDPW